MLNKHLQLCQSNDYNIGSRTIFVRNNDVFSFLPMTGVVWHNFKKVLLKFPVIKSEFTPCFLHEVEELTTPLHTSISLSAKWEEKCSALLEWLNEIRYVSLVLNTNGMEIQFGFLHWKTEEIARYIYNRTDDKCLPKIVLSPKYYHFLSLTSIYYSNSTSDLFHSDFH